ncbi:cupin-like domain-containing protein [Chitinimonas koreensis]|uniref:cupin-like domain-containing protein n=1 Tax=Chitinimonas koreensis TaxID=356302 RepID=UPI00048C211A|nr:cupin-like domain-containing protein [Chitinimonas koreensis]
METKHVDNEWRRWIAENLLLDGEPGSIFGAMVENGIHPEEAGRELDAALASPYLAGAARLRNRLRKRTWPLDIQRKLNRLDGRTHQVPRRHRLDGQAFFEEFYALNRPVIITGMLDDWPARTRWNHDYFRSRFGEREVEVQYGRSGDANFEVNQPRLRRTMRFGDYVDQVEAAGETNDFYMTANNTSRNREALTELWDDIGRLPEYLDGSRDGFLWFGPRGTRTPLHHDLTNNFMAQVAGRKRVVLVPAVELGQVYNDLHCYTPVDAGRVDYDRFPLMRDAQRLEVELAPGEILFLPVGCWHYVEGLDVSITMSFINFRWDNDFASFYGTYHGV